MSADRVILGEGAIYSTDTEKTGLNNNILVIGTSGCGKTMSISEPRLLETYNSSLIVTVTKRRIVNKYKPVFQKRGYVVRDLNFVNPLESDIGYDPLQYLNSYSDIAFLAESIVKSNPRKEKSHADPYWDDAAISLLSAEIAYVLMTKKDATFADVLEIQDEINYQEEGGLIVTSIDSKFKRIEEKGPSFALSCWRSFCRLPIRTAASVFGTLNTTINAIFTPEVRQLISMKNKIKFEKIASEKTVLFISTSAVNPALNYFVNMFYGQAFKKLFEFAEKRPNGQLPIPVHVLCDDFATGSPILLFPEYISIFREKLLSVTLLVQSESQIERMYGSDDATTIQNNVDTYVYMGGMDLKTCRSISERLNVPLEDVLSMPVGQEYIFRRGQKPIITKRYDIQQNTLYIAITRKYENNIAALNAER